MKSLAGFSLFLLLPIPAFTQGDLDPAAVPAPTMHSLDELWSELGVTQGQIAGVEGQVAEVASQVSGLETDVTALVDRMETLEVQNEGFANLLLRIGETLDVLPWAITDARSAVYQSSLAFDGNGRPCFAYYYSPTTRLLFAIRATPGSVSWTLSQVDASASVGGWCDLAFTPSDQPAISYYDATNKDLKYAVRQADASWDLQTVDDKGEIGSHTSLAFQPSGFPAISYTDDSNGKLRYARGAYILAGNLVWTRETIDDGEDDVRGTSLVFTPDGYPAIAYGTTVGATHPVKLAEFDGTNWNITTIGAGGNITGTDPSLALGPSGDPAIAYTHSTDGALTYTWRYDGVWTTVEVDLERSLYPSLAFDPAGRPVISYYDDTHGDLKLATLVGTRWQISVIESAGDVGRYSSLAFTPDGQPAMTYQDGSRSVLKYAERTPFAAP